MGLKEALEYVGTTEASGQLQLDLLKFEGCVPESFVLDIGCGTLNAGLHIIRWLELGHFAGIEPNKWLVDTALENPKAAETVRG